ncbi:MAG TPA: hypothetical protein VJK30_03015 [Coxiellaceae bacterium]|nr:MAG: hypothetical protein A3E81_03015 [Gammaproteobacteria bacterium RIFCSPHIGHO2_12_FULL_36_30]HLB56286.1 hypothetical protein [Coxiellaceae bacterium]
MQTHPNNEKRVNGQLHQPSSPSHAKNPQTLAAQHAKNARAAQTEAARIAANVAKQLAQP